MYYFEDLGKQDVDGHRYVFQLCGVQMHERGVEIFDWCEEHFGRIENLSGRWLGDYGARKFWFRNEDDAFAFRMRWC